VTAIGPNEQSMTLRFRTISRLGAKVPARLSLEHRRDCSQRACTRRHLDPLYANHTAESPLNAFEPPRRSARWASMAHTAATSARSRFRGRACHPAQGEKHWRQPMGVDRRSCCTSSAGLSDNVALVRPVGARAVPPPFCSRQELDGVAAAFAPTAVMADGVVTL
jgi:hypothetical protein